MSRRPGSYRLAAIFLSSVTTGAIALVVALHANAESDRKWCSVVAVMDQAYAESPPTTPTGKKLARGIADLRGSLECPPGT